MVVYDCSNEASFRALGGFMSEAKTHGAGSSPGVLCANKVDLKRTVSEDDGRKFAKKYGLEYFETSAQSGANVTDVFEHLFLEVV